MIFIDKILNEWSFRCHDGIVDLKDPVKVSILNEILKKFDLQIQINEEEEDDNLLNEIKAIRIKIGDVYTLSSDLGNFKAGDKITVSNKKPFGDDWQITMINDKGIKDIFTIDKDDEFESLD